MQRRPTYDIPGYVIGSTESTDTTQVLVAIYSKIDYMTALVLLLAGTAQGLGMCFGGVNGSFELAYMHTCASPLGGLALAMETGEYAQHRAR